MVENVEYLKSYLNSKKNALSFYTKPLLDENIPKTDYYYYLDQVLSFIVDAKRVITSLNIDKIPINDFFNELYVLSKANIKEATNIIEEYSYENILNEEYNSSIDLIKNGEIPKNEKNLLMEFFINKDLIPEKDQVFVYEFYIKNVLIKEKSISYNTFENVFLKYATLHFKVNNYSVVPKIMHDYDLYYFPKDLKIGLFSKEQIANMYNTSFYEPIRQLYHDLMISKIEIEGGNDYVNKDSILAKLMPEYSLDNYLYKEAIANKYSFEAILDLFKRFNVIFKNNENPYTEEIEKLDKIISNPLRKYNGKEIDINELYNLIMAKRKSNENDMQRDKLL